MTKEQAIEIKRICGILEECEQDLDSMEYQLEKEWQGMDGDTQNDNQDTGRLIDEIHELSYTVRLGYQSVMDRLDDASGGVTE